jgi:hypothetical protein
MEHSSKLCSKVDHVRRSKSSSESTQGKNDSSIRKSGLPDAVYPLRKTHIHMKAFLENAGFHLWLKKMLHFEVDESFS